MTQTSPSQALDVALVRQDFPVLQKPLPKGVPLTFLDNASSTQKPQCVLDKQQEVQENYYANAYRGVYRFGARVDEELELTRLSVKDLIGAESPDEIIFTAGTTMSLNMVAYGWCRRHLKAGDEVLLSVMEHHANFVPWQQMAEQHGAQCRFLPLTDDGRLDVSRLDEFLTSKTKIVAISAMSNVLGTVNPVQEIARRAHDVGAVVVVDGAQSVPRSPTDIRRLGADFFAFSSHKLYGPSGVGVLYGRHELLTEMDPFHFGGHMIEQVTQKGSTWATPPAKFEAGTLPLVQAIGLRAAIEYVQRLGLDNIHRHEQELAEAAYRRLLEIPGMRIHGPTLDHRGAILSFTLERAHPEDLAQLLDRRGVFVRHGHHCTMPLHEKLGVPATVRVSFGCYNSHEDIDHLIEAMDFAMQRLRLK